MRGQLLCAWAHVLDGISVADVLNRLPVCPFSTEMLCVLHSEGCPLSPDTLVSSCEAAIRVVKYLFALVAFRMYALHVSSHTYSYAEPLPRVRPETLRAEEYMVRAVQISKSRTGRQAQGLASARFLGISFKWIPGFAEAWARFRPALLRAVVLERACVDHVFVKELINVRDTDSLSKLGRDGRVMPSTALYGTVLVDVRKVL